MPRDLSEALQALHRAVGKGEVSQHAYGSLIKELMRNERLSWKSRCAFCGDPTTYWEVPADIYLPLAPVLDGQTYCFECFLAAWKLLNIDGKVFNVVVDDNTTP